MIRVLVVDDSSVYRMLLKKMLDAFDDVEVVGVASGGRDAIAKIPDLKPDVLTLDMNMPDMDGMATLGVVSAKYPNVKVIVVASETKNDAERAVLVLEAGAFDFVLKPKASDVEPIRLLREELHPKIQAAVSRSMFLKRSHSGLKNRKNAPTVVMSVKNSANKTIPPARPARFKPEIIAIGSSTGGPAALHEVMPVIRGDIHVPVVIIQHMPKLFIESLAKRLDSDMSLHCCVGENGMVLKPGCVYFAPGEQHMDIIRSGTELMIKLNDSPPEHHCRPAVDVTLRSLALLAPSVQTLVVILTGMGTDGAAGAKLLSGKRCWVIAQDEESSVVWGMPGETVRMGAAHDVLPLDDIGGRINSLVSR